MNWPKVNNPLKLYFLKTHYGIIKILEVISHAGLLIYCFRAGDLPQVSLLRFTCLISLYILILNIWLIFMAIVLQVKQKIFLAYESILIVSMVFVYGAVTALVLLNRPIESPEYLVQSSNDKKENEKYNEDLEYVVITTQPPKIQIINNDWDIYSIPNLEEALVIPILLIFFQLLIILNNTYEDFPNEALESESHEHRGERISLTVMESRERNLNSRREERERRFATEEGEVLTPDTVATVSETRQQSSLSLQPEAPVHKESTCVEEESIAPCPRASALEPSSDSEGSSLTRRKSRESKSTTPEPPVREEK